MILERYTSNDLGTKVYFRTNIDSSEYRVYIKGNDNIVNEVILY